MKFYFSQFYFVFIKIRISTKFAILNLQLKKLQISKIFLILEISALNLKQRMSRLQDI